MASWSISPCVAMMSMPPSASTRPTASRSLGKRFARTHTYSMMNTRPTCSMVVPTPALV